MRVKKLVNFQVMAKSKKVIAAVATLASKGSKNLVVEVEPYATKLKIWEESTINEEMLVKLHEDGFLPEKDLTEWKVPGNHRVPELEEGEIVLFTPFIERGLGLPASDFFHGWLHYYGIRMNHRNPNSIMQLSIFVHLCEAFLGIPPSLEFLLSSSNPTQALPI